LPLYFTLKTEAAGSSETLETIYGGYKVSTKEENYLNFYRPENFKSQKDE
jgi:hypothetical protein